MENYTLMAISGSLRTGSSNTALLQAAASLAPADVKVELYYGIGDIPPYNPDREEEVIPAVMDFRSRIRTADGLLICSPEYARGVPGALKNAFDWLVGGIEIVRKPVALINASPYSVHAHAALGLILETMSANVIADASVTVALRGRKLSPAGIVGEPDLANALRTALDVLVRSIRESRTVR